MDVRYVNAFVRSICNTFETMCSMRMTVGKPQLKTSDKPSADVSGVIGFSGDAAGCVVLHFEFDVASKIATAFAGMKLAPEDEDFADAIGELANMVAGGAKAQFKGLNISISLPNVIVGKNHNVSVSKSSPRLIVPCETSAGVFWVEMGMELGKAPTEVSQPTAAAGVNA